MMSIKKGCHVKATFSILILYGLFAPQVAGINASLDQLLDLCHELRFVGLICHAKPIGSS